MKYKVADKVRIKSIDWYNENKDTRDFLSFKTSGLPFSPDMAKYCGCIVTIDKAIVRGYGRLGDIYRIKEDDGKWMWNEKMFEGLAEEDNPLDDNIPLPDSFVERMVHKISDSESYSAEPLDIPTMTTDFVKEHGLPCPDGYEFRDENGNAIEAKKIVLEKKPKYPQSYEECCKVLDIDDRELVFNGEYRASKLYWKQLGRLNILNKLLICRDAYWKLAGDWKPEFGGEPYYCIKVANYKVDAKAGFNGLTNCTRNTILAFPTEEMRDAFYENFKDLIEECKELL